jgi:VPDSG-CTERM motif
MRILKLVRLPLIMLAVAICLALPTPSNATLINITINSTTGMPANDINFGLLGNNNPTTNFNFLTSDISLYNSYAGASLSAPVFSGYGNYEDLSTNGNHPVSLTGFDYAVIHYGKGPGGTGKGGGIVFYYLNGMTGDFTFANLGSGPNGFGGISSVRLFTSDGATSVPDGGATVMLLEIALGGLALVKRLAMPRPARASQRQDAP